MLLLRLLSFGCICITNVNAYGGIDLYVLPSSKSVFKKKEHRRDGAQILTITPERFLELILKKTKESVVAAILPGKDETDCMLCAEGYPAVWGAGGMMLSKYPPINFVKVYADHKTAEIERRFDLKLPLLMLFKDGTPHVFVKPIHPWIKSAYNGLYYPDANSSPEGVAAWIEEETMIGYFHIREYQEVMPDDKMGGAKNSLTAEASGDSKDSQGQDTRDDPMSKKTRKLHVDEIKELKPLTRTHECTVVGCFTNETSKTFKELAMKGDSMCIFGYTYNRMVPKRWAVKPPAITLTYIGPTGRKVTAVYGGKLDDIDAMRDWVRAYRFPVLWRVEGPERFRALYADGRPMLMLLCDRFNNCDREKKAVKLAQAKLQRRYLGVMVDVAEHWAAELMEKVTVETSDAPVLLIAENMSHEEKTAKRIFKFSGDKHDENAILAWAKEWLKDQSPETSKREL